MAEARVRGSRAKIRKPTILVDGEPMTLSDHCGLCEKPIVFGSRCYLCATGRPRRLLRPDERVRLLRPPARVRVRKEKVA